MPRIIGDVHGKIDDYLEVVLNSHDGYSIQLGDMGFDYSKLDLIYPQQHKFFAGNHDNYNTCLTLPHHLKAENTISPHFGMTEVGMLKFFFIRGERSIDKDNRILGRDFFQEEEFNAMQASDCIRMFAECKPDIVLSHGCPACVIDLFCDPSMTWRGQPILPSFTAKMLEICFEFHKPKQWYFGHYHRNIRRMYKGCMFQCIDELSYIDITI